MITSEPSNDASVLAETLRRMTLRLADETETNALLDAILEFAEHLVPYDSANIRLIENGWISFRGHRGYEKYGIVDWLMSYHEDVSSMETMVETLENLDPIVIPDTESEPRWTTYEQTKHIKSFVSVPIVLGGEIIGLLSLDSETPLAYTKEDADKLSPLADAAAVAIKNARLVAQLEDEVAHRKQAEEALRQSLNDKEVLLRELHHRVKNNLTMISGLINLQGTKFSSQEEFVSHLHDRIHSIALVHEKMYQGETFDTIYLGEYVADLVKSMEAIQDASRPIDLEIDIPGDLTVHLEQAIPIGLILNELVTNAVKHGSQTDGTIGLSMGDTEDGYLLHVWDHGPGVPNLDDLGHGTLGIMLVENLARQIGGNVRFFNDQGFHAELLITKEALAQE